MRKSMKKAAALTLAAVTAASLTACGGSSNSAPAANGSANNDSSADGTVELVFSWWGGDSRHEATEKAIAAFMEKYPNIKVTPEYGAWSGWEEKQSL